MRQNLYPDTLIMLLHLMLAALHCDYSFKYFSAFVKYPQMLDDCRAKALICFCSLEPHIPIIEDYFPNVLSAISHFAHAFVSSARAINHTLYENSGQVYVVWRNLHGGLIPKFVHEYNIPIEYPVSF
jgi:hypothetical protein